MLYPLKDQKIKFCSLSILKHKYKYWMRAFLSIQKLLLGEEFSSAFVRNGQKRNCIFRNLHVWIELLYHSRYGGHLYSINIYFIANRFSFSFPCFVCLFLVCCLKNPGSVAAPLMAQICGVKIHELKVLLWCLLMCVRRAVAKLWRSVYPYVQFTVQPHSLSRSGCCNRTLLF